MQRFAYVFFRFVVPAEPGEKVLRHVGFWVVGFGFWVLGFGFGFWVLGLGFGFWVWVLGFGFWVSPRFACPRTFQVLAGGRLSARGSVFPSLALGALLRGGRGAIMCLMTESTVD